MTTPFQVTFDAHDPAALAAFWAVALNYEIPPPPPGFDSWDDWATAQGIPEENWNDARALEDPAGVGPRLFFQKVPESKTAKNRVHLDVNAQAREDQQRMEAVEELVATLVKAGATYVGHMSQHGVDWVVCADPEGNEFCVH